jgi:hypothetical protein
MKVKIPGMDKEVEVFEVDVRNFKKRVRVFADPQILGNPHLTLRTKLNSYFRLSKSAMKYGNLEAFAVTSLAWFNFLLDEEGKSNFLEVEDLEDI